MMFYDISFLWKGTARPDKKLPVYGNESLAPHISDVDYNYRPAQIVKMKGLKMSFSHKTTEMSHYIPIENGGI